MREPKPGCDVGQGLVDMIEFLTWRPRGSAGVHLHAALLAFTTDWTGGGGRPLYLEGDTTGMVSLDHSTWFHRPARADVISLAQGSKLTPQ